MPKASKKASTRKRTSVKNLSTKTKDISQKEAKRVKGGGSSSITINGVAFKKSSI